MLKLNSRLVFKFLLFFQLSHSETQWVAYCGCPYGMQNVAVTYGKIGEGSEGDGEAVQRFSSPSPQSPSGHGFM